MIRTAVVFAALFAVSSLFARGRVDNLTFGDGGRLENSQGVENALNFPTVNTAYTWGDKFRVLLQAEVYRYQALHFDGNLGEQFLGVSTGLTLGETGFGNISGLAGYGYDLDDKKGDFFLGISHRSSILSLASTKTWAGYDFANSRLRKGFACELYEYGNWNLDGIATTKIFGRRNFLGLQIGYDYFEDKAGALEFDVGAFVGWDATDSKVGSGIGASLRF